MYHPPRGGVRGGRDQFNWDDVKVDKHRENYLGHSLHAPVGRWQQGKDLTWYAKDGKQDDSHKKEINAIKNAEADVMAELLGGGKKRVVTGNVTQQELSNVLKRQQEDEEGDDIKETIQEVTKGFRSSRGLSISEIVTDDSRLIPEEALLPKDKGISVTNWDDKNISENVQTSTFQSEDKKKEKKIKKENKKKKRKKDKHHSNKEKHSKRSKHDLSVSSLQDKDVSNEPNRGRTRYRDHTGNSDHSRKLRPHSYSNSPKRDMKKHRSRSNSPKGDAIRYRSRSKSPMKYRSRSKSPRKDFRDRSPREESVRHRYRSRSKSPKYRSRSKSPRKDFRDRSPRGESVRHRSRSYSPYTYSRPRDRYSSQRYRSNKRYSSENDRRGRNYDRKSNNY